MLSEHDIEWLKLSLIPEIGARRGKKLLERFKTPKAILGASLNELAQVEGVGFELAQKIVAARPGLDLARQLRLIDKNQVDIVPLDSPDYPVNLKAIFDPPLVLFVKGKILPQDYFSIALVGTRMNSFYGRAMAEKLSSQLAQKGFTIVSGGAKGIDTFSHSAALRLKSRTIAVLGSGLDIAYPPENKKLFEGIAGNGAVVSEFLMSTPPSRQNFPMRNRIISGLSLGVVVIEAPQRSGALITASCALEQGREVFSVPGKADSFNSGGTHQLLREGAKLVEKSDDIIEELEPVLKDKIREFKANHFIEEQKTGRALPVRLNDEEKIVYDSVSLQPANLEEIGRRSEFSVHKISGILTALELKGLIKQSLGKMFVKSA